VAVLGLLPRELPSSFEQAMKRSTDATARTDDSMRFFIASPSHVTLGKTATGSHSAP
jgi:hypothetical protein